MKAATENGPAQTNFGRGKRIIFTALFIALSLLLVFAILEIGVRLFTKPLYAILQTDAAVGTIHKPNVREYIWNHESEDMEFIITNSLGYIGHREPSEPKGDALRIALLGDSFTEGLQVDYYQSFPVQLEHALNVAGEDSDPAYEVYNYGVGGTGTFLQLLRYREHVRPYDMDIVGLMFHHNDYVDNLAKINFDINDYAASEERNIWLKSFLLQFELPKFVFGELQHQLWFLRTLQAFGLYELNENLEERFESGMASLADHPEYYTFTFDLIRQLRDDVEADGGTFFVAIKSLHPGYDAPLFVEQNRRLKHYLQEQDITYIESDIYFDQPQGSGGECLTFNCGGHFTAIGHREFANVLYEPVKALVRKNNLSTGNE